MMDKIPKSLTLLPKKKQNNNLESSSCLDRFTQSRPIVNRETGSTTINNERWLYLRPTVCSHLVLSDGRELVSYHQNKHATKKEKITRNVIHSQMSTPARVVHIIPNKTTDILNFQEWREAKNAQGRPVERGGGWGERKTSGLAKRRLDFTSLSLGRP